ncbi:MAG: SCO family protein [Verrucomicrobia bacterium]|nr:SCO family protein [Verrucomicrobiota bacterium]
MMLIRFASLLVLLLVGVTVSCREKNPVTPASAPSAASTNRQTFQVNGVLKELKPDGKTAVIKHEEIPGYMPAMTMPLVARNTNELARLHSGDAISFRMVVTDDDGWIENIVKTVAAVTNAVPVVESFRRVRNVEPLNLGDQMPDYPFVNEQGKAVKLSDFKGQAVALTFIFTRCPFPLFCPKMSSNFADAYQKLAATPNGVTNWHLFSISFDVAYDTPPVLKAYAEKLRYDPARWNFLTGEMIDIDAITEQFSMKFSRSQNGIGFDHNLRTVIINPQGRVHEMLIGNEWKSDDLVLLLEQAARMK